MYSIADIENFCELMYRGSDPGFSVDNLYLVPYGYPIYFTELAPGETRTGLIQLSANADFVALGLSHFATVESDVPTIFTKFAPNVRALLTDTSSGDAFTQNAAHLEMWSANGMGESNFAFPRLLSGRGVVSVQVTNIDASAEYARLDLFLHGVLVRAWHSAPRSRQV